jgi:hypothetical protein
MGGFFVVEIQKSNGIHGTPKNPLNPLKSVKSAVKSWVA